MGFYDDEYFHELFHEDDEFYELTEEENEDIERIHQEELDKYGGYPNTNEEFKIYIQQLQLRVKEYLKERNAKKEKKPTKLELQIEEMKKKYPPVSPERRQSKEYQEKLKQFFEDGEKIKYSMEQIRKRRSNPENYTMEKMIEMAEQVDRDEKDFKDVYELTKDDEE